MPIEIRALPYPVEPVAVGCESDCYLGMASCRLPTSTDQNQIASLINTVLVVENCSFSQIKWSTVESDHVSPVRFSLKIQGQG